MKTAKVIWVVLGGTAFCVLISMATAVIDQSMAMQSEKVIEAFIEPMKLYDLPPPH